MNKEQLKVYNRQRARLGRATVKANDDDENGQAVVTNFQSNTAGVLPFTPTGLADQDTEDFKKSISTQLDDISNATNFLFDAYDNATEAASDAKDAYDAAQQAQSDANDAQQSADEAYDKALANAQDIVTLQGDISDINTTIGDISDEMTGIETTVANQGASITEIEGVTDDYTAQWGIKTDINGIINGVGFIADSDGAAFVVKADEMIFTDGTSEVTPFRVEGDTVYMDNVSISGDMESDNFVDSTSGWELGQDGTVQINGNNSTGHMTITPTNINIYEGSTLKVKIGYLGA